MPLEMVLHFPGKDLSPHNQFSGMTSQKCCPIKFGTVVDDEGMVVELPCSGEDCAWFFDGRCSIKIIAQELSSSQSKKYHKRMAAD